MDQKPAQWRPCEVATFGCSLPDDALHDPDFRRTSWALISTEDRDHEEMIKWYYELQDRVKRMNGRILACQRDIIEHELAREIGLAHSKVDQLKLLFSEQAELYRELNVAKESLGWGPEELVPRYWGWSVTVGGS